MDVVVRERSRLKALLGAASGTLRSLAGSPLPAPDQPFLAKADGFSMHAGVAAGADDRQRVERPCRYIAWPAIAIWQLFPRTSAAVKGQGTA